MNKVLVAVSGGPDSVACLLVLLRLRRRFDFEVVASHFDHRLRPESRDDMEFVRTLCGQLDVPCFTGEGDVGAVARENRANVEDTARRMRYQFLSFVAGKESAGCVATGHTADDQAETVLMRVIRGSGVRGVRGMLPVADVPGGGAQRLIRPLLPLRHADTGAICAEAGIEPRADITNLDPALFRNRIRNEALPLLRSINPSVDQALIGLAASAREVFAGIERQSLAVQPANRGPRGSIFALAPLAALPAEALTLVIERESGFSKLQPEVNRTRIQNLRAVLASASGSVRFGDTIVEASCGKVRVGPDRAEQATFEPRVLNVPGATVAGPWRIDVATSPPAGEGLPVSASRLRGALRVRPLAAGDRMRYHGIVRKVSDVLANAKVPRWERAGVVAVADSEGVVALGGAVALADPVAEEDALYVRFVPAG